MMLNSDPERQIFLSTPKTMIHSFSCISFDLNVEIAINKSCSYRLTSAILKVGVVCDVAMKSTSNVLTKCYMT